MGRPKKNAVEPAVQLNDQEAAVQTLSVETPQDTESQDNQEETTLHPQPEDGEELQETVPEQPEKEEDKQDTDHSIEEGEEEQPEHQTPIPANVDRLLKIFHNQPELHIGEKGGVYSTEHKEFNTKKYTNPYYKK